MRIVPALALVALLAAPAGAQDGLAIPEAGYVASTEVSLLPEPVRRTRARLIEIARSGSMDALKQFFDAQRQPVTVTFGGDVDVIEHLKQQSADGQGLEILAILADLLEAPFAAMDGGDGEAIFVWPYLAAMDDLSALTPVDIVTAYRTAGHANVELMREFGGWIWWRVFMDADGNVTAFVAGD